MNRKLKPLIVIITVLGLVGGGYWYFTQDPNRVTRLQLSLGLITKAQATGVQTVSGYIEADETRLAAEVKGRIARLAVDEGDYVEAGQVLVWLDTALLEAEAAQAQANVDTAQAKLAKARAGAPAVEIGKAEATVEVARAKAHTAYVQWQDSLALRNNPQELDMQIDAARTALTLAELRLQQTIPLKDAGEGRWDAWHARWDWLQDSHHMCKSNPITGEKMCLNIEATEGQKQDAGVAWNYVGADMWQAWVDLNSAAVALEDAEIRLNDLLRLKNNPQEAQIKVAQAEAVYNVAQAELEVTKAKLAALQAGPRPEQVVVAQAQVDQARAGLAALQVKENKHSLAAPQAGWVVARVVNEGEMATPGARLLTLADWRRVNLIVYVPEPDIDTVSVGQQINVYVDAFPGHAFAGTITAISDQAEFTPQNVQTQEERQNTVFAVKIRLDNDDQRLKPGMPADAVLPEGPEL
jgi:HlyD family secretion protein